jgi:hypothetical protein
MAKRNLTLILAAFLPITALAGSPQDGRESAASKPALERSEKLSRGDNPQGRRDPDARRDGRTDPEKSKRNRQLWENMPEEERELLRRKAREMHQNAKNRVEEILRQNEVRFSPEQRAEFIRRYMEERREIEQILRERMQQERERMEAAAIQKIQAEIQATPE